MIGRGRRNFGAEVWDQLGQRELQKYHGNSKNYKNITFDENFHSIFCEKLKESYKIEDWTENKEIGNLFAFKINKHKNRHFGFIESHDAYINIYKYYAILNLGNVKSYWNASERVKVKKGGELPCDNLATTGNEFLQKPGNWLYDFPALNKGP